jgi:hypothetical protein
MHVSPKKLQYLKKIIVDVTSLTIYDLNLVQRFIVVIEFKMVWQETFYLIF